MGNLLAYSMASGLVMLAMYLAYRLFLAQDNQHSFNRGVLLSVYLVAFTAYPVYHFFEKHSTPAETMFTDGGVDAAILTASAAASPPVWGTVLIWIYLVGMAAVATRTLATWIRIVRVIRSGKKTREERYTLVTMDSDRIAPFSWMHYIVISQKDLERDHSAIISHELKHLRSHHWIDLFIAQAVCIINWFNPAAWLMRDELMLVHEYQADMAVIENGHNPQEYQMLLIKKAVGARFPSLANSINHSKLKKRITMMYKSKSGAGRKMKALALVPMVALAFGVASVPAVKAAVSTISSSKVTIAKGSEVTVGKGSENLSEDQKFRVTYLDNDGDKTTLIVKGEGLGNNLTVSGGTFSNKGNTYQAKSLNCKMTDGGAEITAVFPFSDNYENASVTLTINGEDVKLDLEDFLKKPQLKYHAVSNDETHIVISDDDNIQTIYEKIDIYLDGKKISKEEMDALNPVSIASITINKKENDTSEIIIKSK